MTKKKSKKEEAKKLHRASICFYGGDSLDDPIAVKLEFDEDVEENGEEPPVYKLSREMYYLVAAEIADQMGSLFGIEGDFQEDEEEKEEDARKTTRAKGNTTIN